MESHIWRNKQKTQKKHTVHVNYGQLRVTVPVSLEIDSKGWRHREPFGA